jgi:hypothetical protein
VRHLDGDRTVKLLVVGEVDDAEASPAQHFLDPVAANHYREVGRCVACAGYLRGGRYEGAGQDFGLAHGRQPPWAAVEMRDRLA